MANVGPESTLHNTSIQIRSVIPEFDALKPRDVPFLKLISGGSEEMPSLNSLSKPCEAVKFEWLELDEPGYTTAILTGHALDDSTAEVYVTAADAPTLVEGTVLKIEDEYVIVKSTATGANPVPITRACAGTTAAAHAVDTVVTVVGSALVETQDAPDTYEVDLTNPYNYVQLFSATVSVSEMRQAIKEYGVEDAIEFHTAMQSARLYRLMNRACFYGKRYNASGTTLPYLMGGLKDFIPSANKTDLESASLQLDDFKTMVRGIFDQTGGKGVPDLLVCNSFVREKLTDIFSGEGITIYRDEKERRGGLVLDKFLTHWGEFSVLVDQDCQTDHLYFLRTEKLGFGPLAGMEMKRKPLAETGAVMKMMIYGSYTLQVRASTSHGLLYGISTTA